MDTMPEISIVIPAYNEESRLPKYLDSILTYFAHKDISCEIIVVDDGSTDSTAAVVERFMKQNSNVKLVRLPNNHGKGYSVKTGMLQASGKLRLFTDADGATPINELERLLVAIKQGADVSVASRALHDALCTVSARLHRKIIGTIFNYIVRALTVKGIHDTQCGFKLFTAESANIIFPLQRINGFGFDVELIFICNKKGYKIKEVPVNWAEVPKSKVKLFRDSIRMFIDIFKIRFNNSQGFYDIH